MNDTAASVATSAAASPAASTSINAASTGINFYMHSPLKLTFLDPKQRKILRTYFLLGTVPKNVLEAAKRTPKKDKDVKILKTFYGPQWKRKLSGSKEYAANVPVWGGAQKFGFDMDELNDPNFASKAWSKETKTSFAQWQTVSDKDLYSTVGIYPEDSVLDLRTKIQAATGVPFYRQHLFLRTSDGYIRYPYQIKVDGNSVPIDSMNMFSGAIDLVAGFPTDKRLESKKDNATFDIHASDAFWRMEISPGNYVENVFLIDLYEVLPPLVSVERPSDNLSTVLQDQYQTDLLYYGGIIKYWPQLSIETFIMAMNNPEEIAENYPLLYPPQKETETRVATEQEIVDKVYGFRFSKDPNIQSSIAITSATLEVTPLNMRMKVNVRNIFDAVPLSTILLAASTRFNTVDKLSGTNKVGLYYKRYASSFLPRQDAPVKWFLLHIHKDTNSVHYAIAADSITSKSSQALAYFSIYENGKYIIQSWWREDSRINFDMVVNDTITLIQPLIQKINNMGAAALPLGDTLRLPDSSANFGLINVSTFWPRAITSLGFKNLKDQWRIYEKAGIISIKGLQQSSGIFVFQFRKGITQYAEKKEDDIQNMYAYLFDASVLQKWANTFGGRTVRIFHRATDLKIEVIAANGLAEFNHIKKYLFSFLEDSISGPNKIPGILDLESKNSAEVMHGPGTKRLRRLQERDPRLYDLKRYDENATVYSVLCQAGRQPHIYSENEYKVMNEKKKTRLVPFWNFTENNKAYYDCPSPLYPYLSFRSNIHPLGYCLPCCKKTRAATGSRAALVNSTCVQEYAKGKKDAAVHFDDVSESRHVLSYGKAIPVGRVGETPPIFSNNLMVNAVPHPYSLCAIGVDQTTPSVPAAGFMYSILDAIAVSGETMSDVINNICQVVIATDDKFRNICSSIANVFETAQDFADMMVNVFVKKANILSPFSPGGAAGNTWEGIICDIVRVIYGLNVVRISDPRGDGDATIDVSSSSLIAILKDSHVFAGDSIILIMDNPVGTYPIYIIDSRSYLRTPMEFRWMMARKEFESLETNENNSKNTEYVVDHVAERLRDILYKSTHLERPVSQDQNVVLHSEPDLGLISKFISKKSMTAYKLINHKDLCYGVIFKSDADHVYIPVVESPHVPDGIPIEYGPRKKLALPKDSLDKLIRAINSFIEDTKEPYAHIVPETVLVNDHSQTIGFSTRTLYYYHDPVQYHSLSLPVIRLPYDPLDIDQALYTASQNKTYKVQPSIIANTTSYMNKLYRMFLAEFASVLLREKDVELRKQISELIRRTNFNLSTSISTFRDSLRSLLADYPNDVSTLINIQLRASSRSKNIAKYMEEILHETCFEFDQMSLRILRKKKDNKDIILFLKKLMTPRIQLVDAKNMKHVGNIYVSCSLPSSVDRSQCENGKLVVPEERFFALLSILASDIKNKYKSNIIDSALSGSFDDTMFIERPGEVIYVEQKIPRLNS